MSDLISRQAAIEATWFEPSYTDPLNVLTEVRDRLKALPSVQPKPKTDVLDKIRTEIKQEYKVESEHPYGQGLRRALQIIDKHKAESEVE